jgi:hypothetical protein
MVFLAAGNVVIPAILTLKQLGYTIETSEESDDQVFIAKKNGYSFYADDPITVLGLIKIFETRGEEWMASDEEIRSVGHEYHLFE